MVAKGMTLFPILQAIVQKHNYLTDEAMVEVARELDISAPRSLWDSFFLHFSLDTQVKGKYVIRVCKTITCSMKGKSDIIQTIEEILKIKRSKRPSRCQRRTRD